MNLKEIKRRVEDASKKDKESIGFMLDALQKDAPNRYIKYLDTVVRDITSLLRNDISAALQRKIKNTASKNSGKVSNEPFDPTNRAALEEAIEATRDEVAYVREQIAKYRQETKNPYSRHESETTAQQSPSNTAIPSNLKKDLREAIAKLDKLEAAHADDESTEYKNLLKAYQESKGVTVVGKTTRGHVPLEMQLAQTEPSEDDNKPTLYDRYVEIESNIDAIIRGEEDAPELSAVVKEYKKTNDLADSYFTDIDFHGLRTKVEKSVLARSNKEDDPRLVAALRLFSEIEKNDPDLWGSDQLKKIYTDYVIPILKAVDTMDGNIFDSRVSDADEDKPDYEHSSDYDNLHEGRKYREQQNALALEEAKAKAKRENRELTPKEKRELKAAKLTPEQREEYDKLLSSLEAYESKLSRLTPEQRKARENVLHAYESNVDEFLDKAIKSNSEWNAINERKGVKSSENLEDPLKDRLRQLTPKQQEEYDDLKSLNERKAFLDKIESEGKAETYKEYNLKLQPLFAKLFEALTEGGDDSIINQYLNGEKVASNLNRVKQAKELAANIKRDPFTIRRSQGAVGSKGFRLSSIDAAKAYDFSSWVYPNNFYLALARALVEAFNKPDTYLNRRGETTFEEYISGEDRGWRSFKKKLPTSGGVPVDVEITGNEIFSSEANLNTKGESKGGGYVDIWVTINGSVMEFNRGNGNPITAILSKVIDEELKGKLFSIANIRNHNMKESQFTLNRAGGEAEARREAYELTRAGRLYGILGFFAVQAAGEVNSLEDAEGKVNWQSVENYLRKFPESILSPELKERGNAFFSRQLSSIAKQKLTPETKETLDDVAGGELDNDKLANTAVILYHFEELAKEKVGLSSISALGTGVRSAELSLGAERAEGLDGIDGTIQSIIKEGGYGTTQTALLTALDENDVLSIPQYFMASALNMINNDDWTIINWGKTGNKGVAVHGIFEAASNFLPKGIEYSVYSGNDPKGLGIFAKSFKEVQDYTPEQIERIEEVMAAVDENAKFRTTPEEDEAPAYNTVEGMRGALGELQEKHKDDSRKVLDGRGGSNLSTYISSGAYKEWYELFDAEGRLGELKQHHLFVGMSGYLLEFDFSHGPKDAFVIGWQLSTLLRSTLEGKARESATTFEATRTEMGRTRQSGMDIFNEAIDLLYKHQGDRDFFNEILGRMIDQGLDLDAVRKGDVDGLLSAPGFKDLSPLNKAELILLTHFGTRLDPAAFKYDLPTTTELENWFGPFKKDPDDEDQGPAFGALLSQLSKRYPSLGRSSAGRGRKPKPKEEESAEANLALAEARQEKEDSFREWINEQGDLKQAYARIQQKELDGKPTTARERYLLTLLTRNKSNNFRLVQEYANGSIERNELRGWESRKNIPDS